MVQIIWELAQCSLLELKPDADSVSMEELQKIRAAVSLPIVLLAVSIREMQGVSSPWELTGWLLYLPS